MDRVARGYRCHLGRNWTEDELQELVTNIDEDLGIHCTYRVRGGYGNFRGGYDLIIPYADDDEQLEYNYK